MIQFGAWLPDQPAFQGPHLREALGCLPRLQSYGPMPDLAAQSDALSARPLGAIATRDKGGDDVHIYAGTATALYELQSAGTWNDVSRASPYTAASDSDRWRFAPYGDRMLATNFVDAVQYLDMSTGTDFADLAGTPPKAKYVRAFAGFVFLGFTEDSAFMLANSALNDSEGWTPGTNQSDEIEFPDGGVVTGLAATDALHIFQENTIRRLYYVGLPQVFQIDVIERERGCSVPGTLAQLGRHMFFRSSDGFYVYDGGQAQPIGAEIVDNWWANDRDPSFDYKVTSAVDPVRKIYIVNYVSQNAADGIPDSQITYNWISKLWSHSRVACELVFPALSLGVTLEDLDALYASIDDMTISLDDPIWTGGQPRFAGFTSDYEFGAFAGSNVEARFEPAPVKIGPRRMFMQAARFVVDTESKTLEVKMTENEGTAPAAFSGGQAPAASGRIKLRGSGRFAYFRAVVTAGATWTHAQGLDELEAVGAGAR